MRQRATTDLVWEGYRRRLKERLDSIELGFDLETSTLEELEAKLKELKSDEFVKTVFVKDFRDAIVNTWKRTVRRLEDRIVEIRTEIEDRNNRLELYRSKVEELVLLSKIEEADNDVNSLAVTYPGTPDVLDDNIRKLSAIVDKLNGYIDSIIGPAEFEEGRYVRGGINAILNENDVTVDKEFRPLYNRSMDFVRSLTKHVLKAKTHLTNLIDIRDKRDARINALAAYRRNIEETFTKVMETYIDYEIKETYELNEKEDVDNIIKSIDNYVDNIWNPTKYTIPELYADDPDFLAAELELKNNFAKINSVMNNLGPISADLDRRFIMRTEIDALNIKIESATNELSAITLGINAAVSPVVVTAYSDVSERIKGFKNSLEKTLPVENIKARMQIVLDTRYRNTNTNKSQEDTDYETLRDTTIPVFSTLIDRLLGNIDTENTILFFEHKKEELIKSLNIQKNQLLALIKTASASMLDSNIGPLDGPRGDEILDFVNTIDKRELETGVPIISTLVVSREDEPFKEHNDIKEIIGEYETKYAEYANILNEFKTIVDRVNKEYADYSLKYGEEVKAYKNAVSVSYTDDNAPSDIAIINLNLDKLRKAATVAKPILDERYDEDDTFAKWNGEVETSYEKLLTETAEWERNKAFYDYYHGIGENNATPIYMIITQNIRRAMENSPLSGDEEEVSISSANKVQTAIDNLRNYKGYLRTVKETINDGIIDDRFNDNAYTRSVINYIDGAINGIGDVDVPKSVIYNLNELLHRINLGIQERLRVLNELNARLVTLDNEVKSVGYLTSEGLVNDEFYRENLDVDAINKYIAAVELYIENPDVQVNSYNEIKTNLLKTTYMSEPAFKTLQNNIEISISRLNRFIEGARARIETLSRMSSSEIAELQLDNDVLAAIRRAEADLAQTEDDINLARVTATGSTSVIEKNNLFQNLIDMVRKAKAKYREESEQLASSLHRWRRENTMNEFNKYAVNVETFLGKLSKVEAEILEEAKTTSNNLDTRMRLYNAYAAVNTETEVYSRTLEEIYNNALNHSGGIEGYIDVLNAKKTQIEDYIRNIEDSLFGDEERFQAITNELEIKKAKLENSINALRGYGLVEPTNARIREFSDIINKTLNKEHMLISPLNYGIADRYQKLLDRVNEIDEAIEALTDEKYEFNDVAVLHINSTSETIPPVVRIETYKGLKVTRTGLLERLRDAKQDAEIYLNNNRTQKERVYDNWASDINKKVEKINTLPESEDNLESDPNVELTLGPLMDYIRAEETSFE